ncbi:MAG: GNAT family N-acetyltransferase [Acidimicrobiia bacterium]
MATTVRAARERDLAHLQHIELDAGSLFIEVGMVSIAQADPPAIEQLREHLVNGTLWVAVDDDDQPVAYASASVVDGEGHLDQVSVQRSHAGRGIGRELIERVCAWAAREGLDAVTLTTFRDVAWNGPLYERYGFEPLTDAEHGPELAAIRTAERSSGIDVAPRIAMRRRL